MKMTLKILSAIWMLPVAIPIWLLYLWPARAIGLIRPVGQKGLITIFKADVRHRGWLSGLWIRLWGCQEIVADGATQGVIFDINGNEDTWKGHTLPGAIVTVVPDDIDHMQHEEHHHKWWERLGILFVPVYFYMLATYTYQFHPMEKAADEYAEETPNDE